MIQDPLIQVEAKLAQQPAAGQVEAANDPGFESRAGQSTMDAAVPFWVTACVRLMPPQRDGRDSGTAADKVLTAVQVLLADRLRGGGDALVELKRDDLATITGYSSGKKVRWIVDYLVEIGFLVVLRHGGGGAGRKPDTFDIYDRPPAHYVGPRTYADLVHALRNPKQTLAKRLFANPQVSNGDPNRNLAVILSDQIDPSSSKKEEGSIEPVPGGTAEPPATGLEESAVAVVREKVRQLPWRKWAKVKLGVLNYQLMRHDADQVQNAMCAAMARDSITLEQATEVARHALAEAKGPVYVVRAFEPKKLGEWLRRLEAEPLAEDTLPLPGAPVTQVSASKSVKPGRGAAAGPDEVATAKPVLPGCPTCEAREGEGVGGRTVVGGDGRHRPCPDCRPAA